jgi:hypothetical protein
MVRSGTSAHGIGADIAILAGSAAILVALPARMFPRIVT